MRTAKALLGLVLVTMVSTTVVRAQQNDARAVTPLTALDYIEIQQLAIRYAYGLDTGAEDGHLYADVFTADGEFIGKTVPLTKGREALARVARSVRKGGPHYVRHFITNHLIEPSPDGAIGKVYIAVIDVEDQQPASIFIGGYYQDWYVRTPAGWRIKKRDARAMVTPRGAQPVLTSQDYIEIQQLATRYAHAMDTGADNGYMYADLFTPDGAFVENGKPVQGREQLAAMVRGGSKPEWAAKHFMMNHLIQPSLEGATGTQYVVAIDFGANGKSGGEFSSTAGHYKDVYIKTAQGWRFRTREYVPGQPRAAR
jgi:hypothetical protein